MNSNRFRRFSGLALVLFPLAANALGFTWAGAQSLATGERHSVVLGSDGTGWSWGRNDRAQLGLGHHGLRNRPHRIEGEIAFKVIASGESHTMGIAEDGRLFTWGRNQEGQLGLGNTLEQATPQQVGESSDWEAVSGGAFHTIAIRGGQLYGWGSNASGQVGDDTYTTRSSPVLIGGSDRWLAVAAGEFHSLAIREDGTLWAWGSNLEGQAGLGAMTVARVPTRVGGEANWSKIAARGWHSLGLKTDGSLWSWGRNTEGQTGLGAAIVRQNIPLRIGVEMNWSAIAAGARHSLALRNNGSLWAWGSNGSGQLGDGTISQRWSPTPVGAGKHWISIAAGSNHSLAGETSGRVFATGANDSGQLGAGITGGGSTSWQVSLFGQPDLEMLSVSLPSPNPPVSLDEPFTVTITGRNSGSGAISEGASFNIEVRLTPVTAWDGAGATVVEGWEMKGPIAVGQVFAETIEVRLSTSIAAGRYYIAARLDSENVIEEVDLGNNTGWSNNSVAFLPDLFLSQINQEPLTAAPGETAVFPVVIGNRGTGTLPAMDLPVSFHLVPSNASGGVPLSNPVAVTTVGMSSVPGGASQSVSLTGKLPVQAPPGVYHLKVVLDEGNLVEESSKLNNSSVTWAPFITVTGVTVEEAIGQPNLSFVSDPDFAWYGLPGVGFLSDSAVTAGLLQAGQSASMRTVVQEPSRVTFRWSSNTRHVENRLIFEAISGETVYRQWISRETDWERVSLDVGAGTVLRWTYEKSVAVEGDSVYVDGLQITSQNLPDFAVVNAVYGPGPYVLQRDSLPVTVTGINFGSNVALPPSFKVTAYLSKDRLPHGDTAIPLGDLTLFRNIDSNNRFAYVANLPLGDAIPAGAYYLKVKVDSGNAVAEFDEDNNVWFSTAADILVERRPNLRVVSVDYPGNVLVNGGELSFDVTIQNDGLASVPFGKRFEIELFLATEATLSGERISLATFPESLGIEAGETVSYEITAPLPAGIVPGAAYYLGVRLDSLGEVAESNETDNSLFSTTPGLVAGEVPLGEALTPSGGSLVVESVADTIPWFGQTAVKLEGTSAAQSGRIGDGRTSTLSARITLDEPGTVSFYWKVSSERIQTGAAIKEDFLAFAINGVEKGRISGEVDWTRLVFDLPAGASTLSWRYVKDGSGAAGMDAGWIDGIGFGADVSLVSLDVALSGGAPAIPAGWIDGGWRTGGEAPWFGQAARPLGSGGTSAADGVAAGQSGYLTPGGKSWVEREIEVAPTGPAKVVFRWKVSSTADLDFLTFSISGVEKARISGEVDWRQEEFLVPAGPQVLRWAYSKGGSQRTGEDAAFLDQVAITPMNLPDLVITDVQFTPGTYVLQRDRLPIQVTVRNDGAALPAVQWSVSDLGVRLTQGKAWGKAEDILLGHFARVESFDSGRRLVFSGELTLPLDAPEGAYHLAILADPFRKVQEWSLENNYFWSAGPEVALRRLPDLVLKSATYDQAKMRFPLSEVNFDFVVANVGLGDVPGNHSFSHRIELRAMARSELEAHASNGTYPDWLGSTLVARLGEVAENGYMPGVSAARPHGSSLSYATRLMLPSEIALLKVLGIVDENYTPVMIRDEDRLRLLDWRFSIVLFVDAEDRVAESDETNVFLGIGRFDIHPLLMDQPYQSLQDWAAAYEVVLPAPGTPEHQDRFRSYAFGLNPHASGSGSVVGHGFLTVAETEFMRVTFDIVKRATDLRYTVEVSSDLSNWQSLAVLEPPFIAEHGPGSLTGLGGLTSQPMVVSAADMGYTASITVRDSEPALGGQARFIRVRVDSR